MKMTAERQHLTKNQIDDWRRKAEEWSDFGITEAEHQRANLAVMLLYALDDFSDLEAALAAETKRRREAESTIKIAHQAISQFARFDALQGYLIRNKHTLLADSGESLPKEP